MKKLILILVIILSSCYDQNEDWQSGCGIVIKKGMIGNVHTIEVKENITDQIFTFQITNIRNQYLEIGSKYCWTFKN